MGQSILAVHKDFVSALSATCKQLIPDFPVGDSVHRQEEEEHVPPRFETC